MKKSHLSFFGVGPLYTLLTALLTLGTLWLDGLEMLPVCRLEALALPAKVLAGALFLFAALLWLGALFVSRIDAHIRQNHLVTTGVYGWVRNPIYTAILFLAWAALLWNGNLALLVLAPVLWLLLTALVTHTEERWLTDLYGAEYLDYCRRVNRCIPRPPRS